MIFLDKLKQKSQSENAAFLDSVIMFFAIAFYSIYRIMGGTLKAVLGFFVGIFGLYVYLGLVGVVLLWVLDAILHGIAGR